LIPTSIRSLRPLGDCPPTRNRESEDLVIVIGGASSTSKTAQGSRPSADGRASPIPTTEVNLSSIEIMRLSCDQPCDNSPEAPETVERGRKEIMPVGCESVACSGKGCLSPGSHKSTTGKIPAAFQEAEIRSQALSQRASIMHHSLGKPDLIGEQIRLCSCGLNPRHVLGFE